MNRSVLVVDDDASVARLVVAVLEREGLGAELVSDGPAALARLQRGGIALVLTDMTMPGMSGLELVREAEARGVTAPFLLMSAFLDTPTERTLFAEPGILGVLRKPFELARLLADVQTVLAAVAAGAEPVESGESDESGESGEALPTFALVPQWVFRTWPTAPAAVGGAASPALIARSQAASAAGGLTGMAAVPVPFAPC